jgi:hypothetical protein
MMMMMIEGPPLFGARCQRGSVLTIYPCAGGVYLHDYLPILGLWTCMNLIVWCDEW